MSASVTITVPMVPDKCLNINSRCHWSQVRACARRLREAAWLSVLGQRAVWDGPAGVVLLDADIRWPVGARIKDDDNCWAMLKALRDGLADGLFGGVDAHIRQGTLSQAVTGEGVTIVTLRVDENTAPGSDESGVLASGSISA